MPITNAKQWREQQSKKIELELPSGLVVGVRRPPLHMWISAGKLPENLVKAMLASRDPQQVASVQMTPEQFKDLFRFMRETIVATVVEPRIVVGATSDDEIDPDDVPLDDAMFIFQWAMAGGAIPPQQRAAQKANPAGSGVMSVDVTDLEHFRTF
jgi:hypothetical protein